MTLFRRVEGVVEWFDNAGNPINPDGSPRSGPTLDALGGPDGSSGFDEPTPAAPPPAPAPPAPRPPGTAQLLVQVTDAASGAAIAGAAVLISSTFTGSTRSATDARGVATFVVAVGQDVEVNVIDGEYQNNDHIVHIYDASDHWYPVALARGSSAPAPAPPPGVPPQIVLRGGDIGPLTEPTLEGAPDRAPGAYARAAFETRAGVPSITAESFSALGGFDLSPSPVGIFTGIISGLLGLFKGSSGGADISRLSTVVQNIGDLLLKTVAAVADGAARSVHSDTQAGSLFDHILGGVLGPIINALAAVIRGGAGDLSKLFGPISDSIKKLLATVKHIYDAWLRPIIKAIDTTRQLLRILEQFHIKWAAEADAALGRLEGKLTEPLLKTIQQLNKVSNVVNRIVTLDGALQRVTLLKSLVKHQTCVQRAIDAAPMAAAGTYPTKLPAPAAEMTLEEWQAGLLSGLPS